MIEVEHLHKIYGSTPAIQDITFGVEKGEILGFLGPNGAGKTTTMRILTGYLPATSGSVKIAGFDVHEQSMEVRRRIGYLPEVPPLYPEMTVEGFLHFVARIKGVPAGDRPTRVKLAMRRCNLLEKQKVLIRKLSKGFRQRVGIAQAIVHDPPAIILDEPTVGLDPRQIIEVRNLIRSLAGEHTIILSTHILPEVSMTCSRVAIINRGRVVATNTPDQLMAQLAGGSGYELEVEGDLAMLQPRLQGVPGVRGVKAIAEPYLPDNLCKLHIDLEPGSDPGRQIASTVVGLGMGLYEMKRVRVSLEDVFLELTTEEKATDLAAAADEAAPDSNPSDSPATDLADTDPLPTPVSAASLTSPATSTEE
ncbi:MAG: ABC transporter ATP-binding protein [Oculatellaceae cyanobacterium Prado106]|jgi:ABC-2 type transport system ATP-binding protein|nr:ABC transporter ATP-binding protein [Oculatellaceae cyanobacterium Prado106]